MDEGDWIVILRRVDGEFDFPNRQWADYKHGFGDKEKSFWLGLKHIRQLTKDKPVKLKVILKDWEGQMKYALYERFNVSREGDGYRLFVDGYSGDAGDSLDFHNGHRFSTKDRDEDAWPSLSCSHEYNGAWWYGYCSRSQLTGRYYAEGESVRSHQGIFWHHWKGRYYSYKYAEMMIMI